MIDTDFKNKVDKEINKLVEKGVTMPNRDELSYLAKFIHYEFIKRYNLEGWQILIEDLGKRYCGLCKFNRYLISLNSTLIGYLDINHWVNTILHELAHAKTGEGHSKTWREFFIQIGGNGKTHSTQSSLQSPLYKYKSICTECGQEFFRHRKRNNGSCFNCSGGIYNPTYKLEWTLNEDYQKKLTA